MIGRVAVLGLIAALAATQAQAQAQRAARVLPRIARSLASPQTACQSAIAAAEVSHGVPAGFMLAMGRVESGRLNPQNGSVQPWPWTIDIDAKGTFFATRADAVSFVETAQQAGIQSIDVGCMQVNLLQHPDAFATLDDAFDPVINANYAARFLVALEHEAGDWVTAAGLYHSHTEALAAPYRQAVALRFGGVAGLPAKPPPVRPVDQLALAWGATLAKPVDTRLHLWPKTPSTPPMSRTVASVQLSSR